VKAILEAENKSSLYFNPQSHQTIAFSDNAETWLVKFMRILSQERRLEDVEKIFDKVSFIVFNYDRCLEHFLVQYCPVNLRGLGQKANGGAAFRVTRGCL
jgi:hypothetical protein